MINFEFFSFFSCRWNLEVTPNEEGEIDIADELAVKEVLVLSLLFCRSDSSSYSPGPCSNAD